MTTRFFDITFSGQILNGHDIESVKNNVKALFGIDQATVDQMFCGEEITLKSKLDRQAAAKYQTALSKAGAKIQITVASDEKANTTVQAQPKSENENTSKTQNLAGKNAASEKERDPEQGSITQINTDHLTLQDNPQKKANPFLTNDHEPALETMPSYPDSIAAHIDSQLTLAERTGDLLTEQEKRKTPVVEIDVSHITLITDR